ncbi:ATP-binding protein [Rhizobium johnstonii]|uniref:ATP-binding protein n=1 Tax=Rhizobium johnstonii TaxID=3019933 RepID=UPI003F9E168F
MISYPTPLDKALRCLLAYSGAFFCLSLAFIHVFVELSGKQGLLADIATSRAVTASVTSILLGYSALLTLRLRTQARSLRKSLDSQTLLDNIRQNFDEELTRGGFQTVALQVLTRFSRHFGAEEFLLEIVDPRTGTIIEAFRSPNPPSSLEPQIKAEFLAKVGLQTEDGHKASHHFVDISKTKTAAFSKIYTTRHTSVGVRTPLGRVGILQLIYPHSRRALANEEVQLLSISLHGLIQAAVNHCKRKNREDLERRLRHAERLQAVGTLAGGIAHEFNNILGAILGYGEMASRLLKNSGDAGRYVGEMMTTARRAEYIVNQILTLSRSRQQERKPFDLIESVADALPMISASLPELEIHAALAPGPGSVIVGHPVELQQIVMNICKNAWEASTGPARVELSIAPVTIADVTALSVGLLQPGRYVRLQISDRGKGIDPDLLPRIFEPFFTTKDRSGGTGLGLATVHGLVTSLDGRVDVTSVVGEGTKFDIYFPQSSLASVPMSHFFDAPRVRIGGGHLIAILDSNPGDLLMQEEKIAALGYEPVGFSNFARFQAWLSQNQPDLLIVDVSSKPAGLTGRDVDALATDAPVILMSPLEKTKELAVHDVRHVTWLSKPLNSKALADAIIGQLNAKKEEVISL